MVCKYPQTWIHLSLYMDLRQNIAFILVDPVIWYRLVLTDNKKFPGWSNGSIFELTYYFGKERYKVVSSLAKALLFGVKPYLNFKMP